jgi:hypothetical protein
MRPLLLLCLALVSVVPGGLVLAGEEAQLEATIELQRDALAAAAASQARIDRTHGETLNLLAEFRALTQELDSLKRYDGHLQRMVEGQQRAISDLERQLDEVAITHREVVPLLERMVESLTRFIELDLPFLIEQRRERAQRLTELIDSPELSLAEKYRRVLEAYRVEAEYGRSMGAYRGPLASADGERTVEFLRVGRVAFIYRTLDGAEAGVWDPATSSWADLSDEYRGRLRQAFRMARKQAAPDLLLLPVPAPEPPS